MKKKVISDQLRKSQCSVAVFRKRRKKVISDQLRKKIAMVVGSLAITCSVKHTWPRMDMQQKVGR